MKDINKPDKRSIIHTFKVGMRQEQSFKFKFQTARNLIYEPKGQAEIAFSNQFFFLGTGHLLDSLVNDKICPQFIVADI